MHSFKRILAAVRAESLALISRGAAAEEALSIALAQNREQSSALAAQAQEIEHHAKLVRWPHKLLRKPNAVRENLMHNDPVQLPRRSFIGVMVSALAAWWGGSGLHTIKAQYEYGPKFWVRG